MFSVSDAAKLVDIAASYAIGYAKDRSAEEVSPDDLLLGCLKAISRFGVVDLGSLVIDLDSLGIDWMREPQPKAANVSYSEDVVRVFDRAAQIARLDGGGKVAIDHLLAAFAGHDCRVMNDLRRVHRMTNSLWRAAAARWGRTSPPAVTPAPVTEPHDLASPREYLSPELAALELGIHVQTVRAYVRSGKLPALRLAGERAIRIRREDLPKVLEPVLAEK